MKTLFKLTLTIASLILLISCSKDPAKSIVGEWKLERLHFVYSQDGKVTQESDQIPLEYEVQIFTFNRDKSLQRYMSHRNEQTGLLESATITGQWSIDGDHLNMKVTLPSGEEESSLLIIKSIAKNELILNDIYVSNDQGFEFKSVTTYYLSRVK